MSRGSQESTRSVEYAALLDVLKEHRLASGLSQAEICRTLGRPRNYVLKIERGERRVDVVELFAYCRAMGVDPLSVLELFASRLEKRI